MLDTQYSAAERAIGRTPVKSRPRTAAPADVMTCLRERVRSFPLIPVSSFNESTSALVQRAPHIIRTEDRNLLEYVPFSARFRRLLRFEQVHRMNMPSIDSNYAFAEERILGG